MRFMIVGVRPASFYAIVGQFCTADCERRTHGSRAELAQLAARAATTRGLPPGALPLPVPSPPPHAAAALQLPSEVEQLLGG